MKKSVENIFEKPATYLESIINQKSLVKYDKKNYLDKSLVLVMFTSACDVGCPFCCFKAISSSCKRDVRNQFNKEGIEKFINFANNANPGYLQISGGGEPFLEKEALLRSVELINVDRIVLVTGGLWAYDFEKAEKYVSEIEQAIKRRKTPSRVSIRLSVSASHSMRLKYHPLENLLNIFENKYRNNEYFTLQVKCFEGDDTLENNLKKIGRNYRIEKFEENKSDDNFMMKIMPWKSKIVFNSGYEVILGKSRIFYPSSIPNLYNENSINKMVELYDIDLEKSQNNFPAIVYNSQGGQGLDWIVEYNGNVSTWQNSIQNNYLNIYEDNFEKIFDQTLQNPLTLSFIDKGAKYREEIVSEVSPKTVKLMKANGIRDYSGKILFEDEKIRLYYCLRVLQDFISDGRINESSLSQLPIEIKNTLNLPKEQIMKLYKKADYSILYQELKKEQDPISFKDFLNSVRLGHFEISDNDIKIAIDHYNMLFPDNRINSLQDISNIDGIETEIRWRKKMSPVNNFLKSNLDNNTEKAIHIFRHGETNWNVEKRIRGQFEDSSLAFTNKGIKQIENLANALKENNIQVIFSSDLRRTRESVMIANKHLNIPVSFHRELRAWNMGKFQGCKMDVFLNDKKAVESLKDHDKVIPGGESINQLVKRMKDFVDKITMESPYQNIAIITHGAAMSNLKSAISGESYIDIDYCKILFSNKTFKVIDSHITKD